MSNENDFQGELGSHRPYLLRYANLQLRNAAVAEDTVQDTLLAALKGEQRYAGRSAIRTWLVGILKHKIVDAIRKQSRETTLASDPGDSDRSEFDHLFKADGHWQESAAEWGSPERSFDHKEFFRVLEECLAKLPKRTAQVFMMREHLGTPTDEICKVLEITPTHCWVLLYRARMSLRACLQQKWFAGARP
ncbi:MAG: sigma-70 family RNA polymerase sigma factor [Betaproteobacteria bacterium]|nr:sigma-70 family RNA polymerase sigma factor [Betaproteobacteria bacterium]